MNNPDPIAVIGMAGRFPGADNISQFWENLVAGKETISRFSAADLEYSVASREAQGAQFVGARGILDKADLFDASFFGITPGDAEVMDPQHRIFLECAWEAFEMAGYDTSRYPGMAGVYAGTGPNTYLLYNLNGTRNLATSLAGNMQVGEYPVMLGNDKDFLPTRVAYKLDLRGPGMAVQCACSTSLVAICQACSALRAYECDMALAGGVSITFPQRRDYRYIEEGMVSPDGTCRAFDAEAKGTVFGHGAAVVVLKRLSDAIADGDSIHAVIHGWAVNNDGSAKMGFAAPGVDGQAEVIAMAHALAGVSPADISYVEAHGTGTPLGDPVEVLALTKAFRQGGAKEKGYCAIGTGKTHIGHLDVAAGATGLIKTILQLRHGKIPALLHFQKPNPAINFAESPFFPVAELQSWNPGPKQRLAGVSSFGVGGTNAHVVVGEPPEPPTDSVPRGEHFLVLSARTPEALDAMAARLATHLESNPNLSLSDVAFTLAMGRKAFEHRRAIQAKDTASAIIALRQPATPPKNDASAVWLQGGTPDWNSIFAAHKYRRIPLPTYPFERKSFWVSRADEKPHPKPGTTAQPLPPEDPLTNLRKLFEDLYGAPLAADTETFESQGLDSLFLAQASVMLMKRLGVKVSFRQLLGETGSIASLAAYVEKHRPPRTQLTETGAPSIPRGARLPVVRWPGDKQPSQSAGRTGPYRPVENISTAPLTARQRESIDRLVERTVRRTAASKAYTASHRPHFADPRAVAGFNPIWKDMVYPIVSERSKGAHLWDIDGNRYVDVTMGFGTYFFGHSPEWLIEATTNQLHQGIEIGPQSKAAGAIAKDICLLTGMERATFCNTGSEAVMAALRLARAVTGRDRIAYFSGDYHGMFDEVLVRGTWPGGVYRAQPIAPGIPDSLVENMLVIDYGTPESLEILRAHAGELAAVLVEPVQSRNPGHQPAEFLRELRGITAGAGCALIFDEVVTGFRCHPGGAQAYFGVRADLATYGKVIGGGIPIGVLAGSRKFMDMLDGGAWDFGDDSRPEVPMTFFAGTFVRHPLAMAAARAVLGQLRAGGPGLQLRLTERTDLLCRSVEAVFDAARVPLSMPHFSACAGIQYPQDLRFAGLLWYYLREKGIHIWENRPVFLTLAHSDEDMDAIVQAFAGSVDEMQEGDLLPGRGTGIGGVRREFPRRDSSPVTEAQREILSSVLMGEDANRAYNESVAIEFEGPLNEQSLEKSVLHIFQRHSALRSTFSEDGALQFYNPPPESFVLPVTDLTSRPDAGEEYARLRRETTSTAFALQSGPLVRLVLVRRSANRSTLIFSAHHLVCDGWSLGMIVQELAASYNAFRAGELPMLPPPIPFGDYARKTAGTASEADRSYWLKIFREGAPALELPTDRPRPTFKTYAGGMESAFVDPELFALLKNKAPTLGGTLFSTLLAAFAAYLHRLSGQEDIVIGVPAAGQTIEGHDELVGHCLNFLPLRLTCPGDMAFTGFARRTRELVIEAFEHQSFTFGSIVSELKLPRDPSRLPLVSAMFNIDRSGFDRLHFDGLTFRVLTNAKQFVNFDIFFNLNQTEESLEVECEYNTDLFDAATIRRWLDGFESLLHGLVADEPANLSRLSVLGAKERESLLTLGEGARSDYPRETPLHSLISATALERSGHPAVLCGEEMWTYSQLEERATAIAAQLAKRGIGPGNFVGVCLERTPEMLAALLGVWKCGAAYVPMDPSFPSGRLLWMLEDANIAAVVTRTALSELLPQTEIPLLCLDSEQPSDCTTFVPCSAGGELPAYVIFTSGSTGRPKGVVVPHRALVNFLESMRREPGLEAGDVLLAVTTLSFDISGLELFLPLLCGATVAIARRESLADGFLLAAEIAKHGVTAMQATPSTWRLLLEAGWQGRREMKILVGGEAVARELVNQLAPLCGEIWNVYGPTETTIWSTTCRLAAGEGPVSIGHPIANTRLYIVNANRELQPRGALGELLIAGDGLALGYARREDLTNERFVSAPANTPDTRVYLTGDIARWNPDGALECLGRLDQQIKIRGHRIETAEIETRLEQHPAIAQAVCVVRDNRLIACVREAPRDSASDWRDQWDLVFRSAIDQAGPGNLQSIDSVITGWTGIEGAKIQVQEWIDSTVSRIRGLQPEKILELGCGTGQLLARLAPEAENYLATDISQVAISALQSIKQPAHVKVQCQPADDFSNIPPLAFDTVVINSVAQYFPDADYLQRVLTGAVRSLVAGGRIFVGDLQSKALLPVFHAAALRERGHSETLCGDFRSLVAKRLESENELSLDPAWFEAAAIEGITHVEILLRRGGITNETTSYHYDAILHTAPMQEIVAVPDPLPWTGLARLKNALSGRPESIAFHAIPDLRLSAPVAFHQKLMEEDNDARLPDECAPPANAVSAETLFAVAESAGFSAHVRWQGDGSAGLLEAVFLPSALDALPLWQPATHSFKPSDLVNTPRQTPRDANLANTLRSFLAEHLPEYMIPTGFVALAEFPLTPNGKIDRVALAKIPMPDDVSARHQTIPPRNEKEAILLDIWKQVLGDGNFGVEDDIFQLGADSILIFQITARAHSAGLPVTPARVFRQRTISAIVAGLKDQTGKPSSGIQRLDRSAYRR